MTELIPQFIDTTVSLRFATRQDQCVLDHSNKGDERIHSGCTRNVCRIFGRGTGIPPVSVEHGRDYHASNGDEQRFASPVNRD